MHFKSIFSAFTTSLVCVALALFSSCTTTPERSQDICASVDWWEMGRTDGVAGLSLEHASTEQSGKCPMNQEAYLNGRDAGLIDYCAPQQGLAAGLSGANYAGVCPAHLEPAFLTQFEIGQRQRALEVKRAEAESEAPDSANF